MLLEVTVGKYLAFCDFVRGYEGLYCRGALSVSVLASYNLWPTGLGGEDGVKESSGRSRRPTFLRTCSSPSCVSSRPTRSTTLMLALCSLNLLKGPHLHLQPRIALARATQRNFATTKLEPAIRDYVHKLAEYQPCFAMSSTNVKILRQPSQFYQTLLVSIPNILGMLRDLT